MYLYGDRFKLVDAWNAVNMPDKDGVLRHGSVISVVDGGLVIDFNCPGQRSEFVEYGRIFDAATFSSVIHSYNNGSDEVRFATDAGIEVLIRVRRDRPWTWLSGKLVTLEPNLHTDLAYAVVEVLIEGSSITELIPCAQIRLPLSSTQLKTAIVGTSDFVTRSCPLPEDYWSSISPVLSCVFSRDLEREHKALPVSFFSESLSYLQRRSQNPVQPEQLATLFMWKQADVACYTDVREYPEKKWICRNLLKPASSMKHPSLPSPEGDLLKTPLPVELLVEIFGCLDTISRIRCRRTCTLWSSVLTVRHLCNDIRISLNQNSFSPSPDYDWSPLYAVTGSVLKCISNITHCVSITGDYTQLSFLGRTVKTSMVYTKLSFLEYVRRTVKGSRMERMIVDNLKCQIRYGSKSMGKAMEDFLRNCDCCQILTFHNATLRFVLDGKYLDGTWEHNLDDTVGFEVHIPFGSVKIGAPDTVIQLWDLVETNSGECDLSFCAQAGAIAEVLNAVQSDDPRETTLYRGRKWIAEEMVGVDFSKMTRITQHALLSLKRPMTPAAGKPARVSRHLPPAF